MTRFWTLNIQIQRGQWGTRRRSTPFEILKSSDQPPLLDDGHLQEMVALVALVPLPLSPAQACQGEGGEGPQTHRRAASKQEEGRGGNPSSHA